MSDVLLAQGLKRQFCESFDLLQAAILAFAPSEWRTGRPPYDGPARAVVHALQCAEYYTSRDATVWARFNPPVWQMAEAQLPTQERMAGYLAEARQATMAWIDDLASAGLDQPADEFGATALESIIYALRHLQHHSGEVCAYQKQFGHPQEHWT